MARDTKTPFIQKLQRLAEALYSGGDSVSHDESWEKRRSFVAGFADAGLTLSLVTSEEIQQVIDKAHVTVYGEDRIARQERLEQSAYGSDADWSVFDEPTYERLDRK